MTRPKRDHTVMVEMIQRGGVRQAYKGMLLVAMWGLSERELGYSPTWQGFSDNWMQSLATTTRQFRAFKKCVPEDVTPHDLVASLSPALFAVESADRMRAVGQVVAGLGQARWSL